MNFEIQEHDIMKKRPIVPLFFILILVLVEDGLWRAYQCSGRGWFTVLILVLVEDGLWHVETDRIPCDLTIVS